MTFEHKDNSGSLFNNDRKQADNHPDFKGSCKIAGVEYWMSSWLNERGEGDYQSIKFQVKDELPNTETRPQKKLSKTKESAADEHERMTGKGLSKEFDDDVPF